MTDTDDAITLACIAYNHVMLYQPEDQRDQPKAMRAALKAMTEATEDLSDKLDATYDRLAIEIEYAGNLEALLREAMNALAPLIDCEPAHDCDAYLIRRCEVDAARDVVQKLQRILGRSETTQETASA